MPIDVITDLTRASATAAGQASGVVNAPPDAVGARRLTAWLEARAMFVIAVSSVLMISLLGIPRHLSQDGWLSLVAGRLVAAHGIPQHDGLSYLTHGVRWVDQQWLAQLLMYEVTRLGGLPLLCVLYVLVATGAFAGAIAVARALGGEDRHVLIATLPGVFFYLATAVSIRTQGLAYPLFVTALWLLSSDLRAPARLRRTHLVFPLLVLWGNLHGSVTLGAGLVVLYGGVVLLREVLGRGWRGLLSRHAIPYMVGAPLTLLVTPYGTGIVHYYSVTLMNSQFSRLVTEWKPVTSVPVLAVPLFVVVGLTLMVVVRGVWRAGRDVAQRPALFDVITLGVLALGATLAVRNVTWFGIALVALLPAMITRMRGGAPAPLRRARANRWLALACAALAALTTVAILARPTAWFTSSYPTQALPTLRALVVRHPRARVLADVRYADWLIWEDPQLFSGRVAYDTSFELLTPSQLSAIADLAARTRAARTLVNDFPIWVLYRGNRRTDRALLRRPGVRVIDRTRTMIIATHGAAASG